MFKKGNSTAITIIVLVVVAVVAGFGYTYLQTNSAESNDLPTSTNQDADSSIEETEEDPIESVKESKYIQYKEGQLEKYEEKRIVLFFYANWCPTCQPVDSAINSRQVELPEDVVVIRVNYNDTDTDDDEDALAQKYNITYQHSFVILDEDEVVAKWNGDSFDRVLEELN